jgi:ATP-dependent Lon protease
VRAHTEALGLPIDFTTKLDIHVHIPGGMIGRDNPSAGLPIFVALASMLTKLRVRPDVGMSGEITLRGNVLPVTGIKEKCLGAHRAGLKRIVLPKRNEADLDDVPEPIKKELEIVLVSRIDEVLPLVLDLESGPGGRTSVPPPPVATAPPS